MSTSEGTIWFNAHLLVRGTFGGRVMPHKNLTRDVEIFAAFEAGRSLEQLGADHNLSTARIHDIIVAQRHKRIVSPEPYYRNLRLCRDS